MKRADNGNQLRQVQLYIDECLIINTWVGDGISLEKVHFAQTLFSPTGQRLFNISYWEEQILGMYMGLYTHPSVCHTLLHISGGPLIPLSWHLALTGSDTGDMLHIGRCLWVHSSVSSFGYLLFIFNLQYDGGCTACYTRLYSKMTAALSTHACHTMSQWMSWDLNRSSNHTPSLSYCIE